MAIVYRADINSVEGQLTAGQYGPLAFSTIDEYMKNLISEGYEIEARPDLHPKVKGKANGLVYSYRKKGSKRWKMFALTRRKGNIDEEPKATNINIRVSEEEKREWEAMAKMQGMSFASWIRWCLNCHTPRGHQRVRAEVEKAQKRGEEFFFSSLPKYRG